MIEAIRLLIVDDHSAVRDSLKSILVDDDTIKVVGEAADGNQAVFKAAQLQPDIVLMDIMMPRCSGLDALPAIRQKAPKARVIMMTVSTAEKDLAAARESGASGYLLKSAGISDFSDAIRRVMAGEIVCSPQMAKYPAQKIQTDLLQQTIPLETKPKSPSFMKMGWRGAGR